MLQNLPQMHATDGRSFFVHLSTAYGSHRAMFHQVESHKLHKIPDVAYALSVPKWLVFYDERHPLLMKCFKIILRYKREMGEAFASICLSVIGPAKPFSIKVGSQIAHKMPHFGYPLSTENWMLNCNERQPLSMKYFKIFLRGIKQVGWASMCIF